MPIVHLTKNCDSIFPSGAYCPLELNTTPEKRANPIVVFTSHDGLCLYKTNSDQASIMTVWNPELQCPERIDTVDMEGGIIFLPDATVDTKAAYEAWITARNHRTSIQARWLKRHQDVLLAQTANLESYHSIRRLRNALSEQQFKSAIALLKVKTFRTTGRSTLAGMIRSWANNPRPKFSTPLSPRQLKSL